METNPTNNSVNQGPTGWENMDAKSNQNTLEPILDIDHSRTEAKETEITLENYEDFANIALTKTLDSLDNPKINSDEIAERELNAQLATIANVFDALNHTEPDQSPDIFSDIRTKYQILRDEHAAHGQTHNANTDQYIIDATELIKNDFDAYINRIHPQPTTNGPSLPGDVIS